MRQMANVPQADCGRKEGMGMAWQYAFVLRWIYLYLLSHPLVWAVAGWR